MANIIIRENGIAVICPTYNSSSYIKRTINCLISQKKIPEEVIFSDDGSDDKTIEIIKKSRNSFEKVGINMIILKNSHCGPGAARNSGIAVAKQPWIAFLDADDIWKKNKILIIQESIKKHPFCNSFLHWEEYKRKNKTRSILYHGKNFNQNDTPLLDQLYIKNFMSTSAMICKRSLIKNVGGFDITLPNAQDYDLWLKLAPQMKLEVLPVVLGVYYEELDSITSRPYYKRFWSEVRIANRYRRKVSKKYYIKKIFKIFLSKQWLYMFYNLLTRNKVHSN